MNFVNRVRDFAKATFQKWRKPAPKRTVIEVPYRAKQDVAQWRMKMTKAYADERQKAPRNRRRKASKRMRNIYKELR